MRTFNPTNILTLHPQNHSLLTGFAGSSGVISQRWTATIQRWASPNVAFATLTSTTSLCWDPPTAWAPPGRTCLTRLVRSSPSSLDMLWRSLRSQACGTLNCSFLTASASYVGLLRKCLRHSYGARWGVIKRGFVPQPLFIMWRSLIPV